jgi:hypothetical protein
MAWKRREEGGTDQSHVTSQTHQTNVACAKLSYNGPLVVITGRRGPTIDAECLDAGTPGDVQPGGFRAIRNDNRNNGIQTPVEDRVDQRLKIAAPARDEHATTAVHARFT